MQHTAHRDAFGTEYNADEYAEILRAQEDNARFWQERTQPAVVVTKDGPQALLEGFTPPPSRIADDTEQLTMF